MARRRAVCLAVLAAVFSCACRSAARPPGITLLIESPPDSLDGQVALSANGERLAQLIAPGLLTFDDDGRPVPDLAAAFHWVDAQTLDVTLRPGLTFHDGSALTAEDAAASYESIRSGAVPSPKAAKLAALQSVEAAGPLLVRFHLRRPYAPLVSQLSLPVLPRGRSGHPPVGAGPFRFLAQPDDEHIELAP